MATLLDIDDLFTPATADQWNGLMLANAATLQLKTTAWQSGGMSRTIIAIQSNMLAQGDGITSIIAQGGFLDFAATGTVTYTAANGETVTQKVTPDPSIAGENPDGTPGWLDVLASSVYNEVRIGAQYASNSLAIVNTTSNTYGPYSPKTYHVTNPDSGAGYSNTENLTIAPANFVGGGVSSASDTSPIVITTNSAHGLVGTESVFIDGILGNDAANGFWEITVLSTTMFSLSNSVGNGSYASGGTVNVCTTGVFAADIVGVAGTSAPGSITEAVTTLSGVDVYNLNSFVGSTWESNTALAARCRLKLQSLSPMGPRGSYEFFALSASKFLAEETPPVQLSTPVTRVKTITSVVTGILTTIVANASGPVSGISNLLVTDATNAAPIVIETESAHGLSSGDFVSISGVIGNTNANSTFNITVVDPTHFSLDGSIGNDTYVSGGVVQGGDLGQVDKVIQTYTTPDDITSITVSAFDFDVQISATIEVPQGKVAIYQASVQSALALYFASLPIGGGADGVIEYEVIIGVLYAAGTIGSQPSYVTKISNLLLNGDTVDLPFPTFQHVAKLNPAPSITVTGS